jgi:hypothetical protein
MIMLHFYLFYYDLFLIIGHGHVLQYYLNKDRFFHHAYIMHSAMPCLHVYQFPNDVQIADR